MMHSRTTKIQNQQLQIFIQSPDLSIPTNALTLNPNLALDHLKQHLLPPQALSRRSSFYFTSNGKPLKDSSTIVSSKVSPLSTLILRSRLSGGGGDGGATGAESRDCYLNMYAEKKPDKVDPNEKRLSKWTTCALSFEPLKPPCVVDKLGSVFNKEALVEALLGKKLPREFSYIKGLRDMINIELSPITGLDDDGFQCPVSGLEFNGKYKFFAIRTCGHVLSAKALKEVKSSECLVCRKEFGESDKLVINGSDEEVAELRERLEDERLKAREKKGKRMKNGEVGIVGSDSSSKLSGSKHEIDVKAVEIEKVSGKLEGNGKVGNGSSITVKGATNGSTKRFKATDMVPANATKEVYASIFTSSKKSNFKETYSCRSLPLGRN